MAGAHLSLTVKSIPGSPFKTVFILYLILPSTRGSQVLFVKVVKPMLGSNKTSSTPVAAPQ